MPKLVAVGFLHGHHACIFVETETHFECAENLIMMLLTPDAPAYDAFVKESFPILALQDPMEFRSAMRRNLKLTSTT